MNQGLRYTLASRSKNFHWGYEMIQRISIHEPSPLSRAITIADAMDAIRDALGRQFIDHLHLMVSFVSDRNEKPRLSYNLSYSIGSDHYNCRNESIEGMIADLQERTQTIHPPGSRLVLETRQEAEAGRHS